MRPLPQPAQSASVVAVQLDGQQPSAIAPLHAFVLQVGSGGPSTDASPGPTLTSAPASRAVPTRGSIIP